MHILFVTVNCHKKTLFQTLFQVDFITYLKHLHLFNTHMVFTAWHGIGGFPNLNGSLEFQLPDPNLA
jgi:hypothetical protein